MKVTFPTIQLTRPRTESLEALWREHGFPLLVYGLLSLALSWPMVESFTSQIPGHSNDAHNGLWVMWHVKEALLGRQPLYELSGLYYPSGATLLTHIPGPLTGFFALPFWPLGPEAAHNGAALVSFVLTGYFMYLLARGLGFSRPVALFAGVLLLVAPMHVTGLWGHTTKVFLGATPLVLLALLQTLNSRRSPWWAAATALALLMTLLHDSFQFIITVMGIAFFALAIFLMARREERNFLLKRGLLLVASCAVIVGPLFVATVLAANAPELDLGRNFDSFTFQPDVIEFILPPAHGRLLGPAISRFLQGHGVSQGIETTVSLSWIGLVLCGIALAKGGNRARLWLLFTFIWVVLALGPALKIMGRLEFTEYSLPVIMPYALFTALPGLDFLRTPGRFMQIGFVGFGIAACFGLAWLTARYPRRGGLIAAVAIVLLLLENWPQPWPRMTLRPTPSFYYDIAEDEATYGVLDIPFKPREEDAAIVYNTHYQMYQMVHKKGIAMGYISRTYDIHPVFPCLIPELLMTPDIQVNGEPVQCYENALYDLAQFNYRYVVRHKPRPEYGDYTPDSWGDQQAAEILDLLFGDQEPLVDDELTTVYEVPAQRGPSQLATSISLRQNWYRIDRDDESTWRWAKSPATFWVYSPRAQAATLEITPFLMYDAGPGGYLGSHGVLDVAMDTGFSTAVELNSGEVTRIPLDLPSGVHALTLSLEAGNFQPAAYDTNDYRWLSFAIRSINLETK